MSVRLTRALAAFVLGGLVLLTVPASAQEQVCYPPPCAPGVSDSTVEPGGDMTATSGSGSFTPGEVVEYGVESTYQRLGEVKADASGAAVATFSVPTDLEVGGHHVVFTSVLTGKQVRVPFTLVAVPATPTEAGSGLPDGIVEVLAVALATALLSTLATRLVLVRRHRRREAELSERLRRVALQDPLTGLAGRALLDDRISLALRQRVREVDTGAAVLRLDLDGFTAVNEALGSEVGDRVLAEVARRLETIARQGDTVARLGGDSFAVLLLDVDVDQAVAVADRVASEIRQAVDMDAAQVTPAGSIGIALSDGSQDSATLLAQADFSLYEAKRHTPGGHKVFGADDVEALGVRQDRRSEPAGNAGAGCSWTTSGA